MAKRCRSARSAFPAAALLPWLLLNGCSKHVERAQLVDHAEDGGRAGESTGESSSGKAGEPAVAGAGALGGAVADGDGGSGNGGSGGGAAGEGAQASVIPSVASVMAEYRSWQPRTPEPVAISDYIFGLCRLPTPLEEQFAASEHGQGRLAQDWANTEGQAGIARRGAPAFAPGAVIVKEKYVRTGAAPELVALGIMIKHEAGFAADKGDWDYVYYDSRLGLIQTEQQQNYCSGCHASASSTDFVFIDGPDLRP